MFIDLKKMYDLLYENSYVNKIINIRKEAIKEMDKVIEKEDSVIKEKSPDDDTVSNTSDEQSS